MRCSTNPRFRAVLKWCGIVISNERSVSFEYRAGRTGALRRNKHFTLFLHTSTKLWQKGRGEKRRARAAQAQKPRRAAL